MVRQSGNDDAGNAGHGVLKQHLQCKSIKCTVTGIPEFYTAVLLEAVGFPPDAFTCVFAMGRVAGWIAHAREQQATGRLIRPQSRYIGPAILMAA